MRKSALSAPAQEPADTAAALAGKKVWSDRIERYSRAVDKALDMSKNIAAVAVVIWAYFYGCFGSSDTSFRFAEANSDVIKLNVTTKAPKLKAAYLREFYIRLDKAVPIEPVQLRMMSDNNDRTWAVVRADESVIVRLTADRLRARCRQNVLSGQTDRYTKKEVSDAVDAGHAILIMAVQESNDNDTQRHQFIQVIPAKTLEEFIDHYLPDNTPLKTSCS